MKMQYKGAIKFQIQQPTVAMVQLMMVKRSSCMYDIIDGLTHLGTNFDIDLFHNGEQI